MSFLPTFRTAIVPLFTSLILVACGGAGEGDAAEASPADSAIALEQKPAALPILPNATMQLLVDSADYVDFVFYNYEFSMSMDNDSGVKYAIATIGEGAAEPSTSCTSIGRIFYQIKGRNAVSAELYFSPGCTYLEFIENGKVVYANGISEVGKDFLNGQFSQLIKGFTRVE